MFKIILKSLNIPNILSLLRIVLVPVFCTVYFSDLEHAKIFAALIYALASLTDMLDGILARRLNQITKLGRILDPLGDKLMCVAAVMCLTISGYIPAWALVVLFVKEAVMGLGGLIMYEKATDVISSNYFGKTATVLFFVVCVVIMVFDGLPKLAATLMISAALALTLIALLSYLIKFFSVMKSGHTE